MDWIYGKGVTFEENHILILTIISGMIAIRQHLGERLR
jgi:hypothetical protein